MSHPLQVHEEPGPGGQQHRIAVLGHRVTDETLPLRSRVAGSLLLLFAQPVTRIVRLTVDDVVQVGDHSALCLGDPPTPSHSPLS